MVALEASGKLTCVAELMTLSTHTNGGSCSGVVLPIPATSTLQGVCQ